LLDDSKLSGLTATDVLCSLDGSKLLGLAAADVLC